MQDLCTLYLADCEIKDSTRAKRKRILDSLCKSHGSLDARELTGDKLKAWMRERHPTANATTQHDRYGIVNMVYNWAKNAGHVVKKPMAGMKRPKPKIREVFLYRERWAELVGLCNPELRLLVEFMLSSGARPQEARALLCGDWIDNHFVLGVHRSKGEERGRAIRVSVGVAERITDAIAGRAPDEPAFVNTAGKPITRGALVCSFRRLRRLMAVEGLVAYSLRHSYAVDKLRFGAKPEFVAQAMGHSSTEMIFKRYGHFAQQTEQLQELADKNAFEF